MQKEAIERETFSGWGRRWGWLRLERPSAATFVNSGKFLSEYKREGPHPGPCLRLPCRIVLSFVCCKCITIRITGSLEQTGTCSLQTAKGSSRENVLGWNSIFPHMCKPLGLCLLSKSINIFIKLYLSCGPYTYKVFSAYVIASILVLL